jgi:hypothetical protein
MILEDGLQRSSLRNNPYVQAPLSKAVKELLSTISVDQSYYDRGTDNATEQLNELLLKHRTWLLPLIDIKDFDHGYITAGATEAINLWRLSDDREWQYLEGDYQWPQMIKADGFETTIYNLDPNKVLYISNPSCIDGNYISNEHIDIINEAGCPVIYDCAYVSASRSHTINIPSNTEQIFFSFSKGFGIIGQRCGLMYSKTPHVILQPLKTVECYNYTSIHIINKLIVAFAVDQMYNSYIDNQQSVCLNYNLVPSDTYFIVTSEDPYYTKRRRRGLTARLCITLSEQPYDI